MLVCGYVLCVMWNVISGYVECWYVGMWNVVCDMLVCGMWYVGMCYVEGDMWVFWYGDRY